MIKNIIKQINMIKRNIINKRLNNTIELMERIIKTEFNIHNIITRNLNGQSAKLLLEDNMVKIFINGKLHSEMKPSMIFNSLDNYKVTPLRILKMLIIYHLDRSTFILQFIESNSLSKEEYKFVEDLINGVI